MEEVRSHWNWAPGSGFLNNSEGKTAHIEPKQLVLLGLGYVIDNVLLAYQDEKRVVFFTILAVVRMVIWTMRKKGLYDGANFCHCELNLFFGQ